MIFLCKATCDEIQSARAKAINNSGDIGEIYSQFFISSSAYVKGIDPNNCKVTVKDEKIGEGEQGRGTEQAKVVSRCRFKAI